MLSGISVIGPLLFLIFINDLIVLLASVGISVKVFADDVKVYVRVTGSTDLIKLHNQHLICWQTGPPNGSYSSLLINVSP